MTANNIITLTTDFGTTDVYVGEMKGVILSRNPNALIVDLTHAVSPQDIRQGARIIFSSYRHFPKGTTHCVVVDPGVGSDRSLLAVRADDHYFVLPDNGTMTCFLESDLIQACYLIQPQTLNLDNPSSTFHGRDIIGPAAAMIAGGMPVTLCGPPRSVQSLARTPLQQPIVTESTIVGHVSHIDHFGNIRSNIQPASFETLLRDRFDHIDLCGYRITSFVKTYSSAPPGSLIALTDSSGFLEIAVNQGNAATMTGTKRYDPITIHLSG